MHSLAGRHLTVFTCLSTGHKAIRVRSSSYSHPHVHSKPRMAGDKKSHEDSIPVRSKKPKLQRVLLTQTPNMQTTQWRRKRHDINSGCDCRRTGKRPLPTEFELSEATTNIDRFSVTVEQGRRPKSA
jgi:hypothetical protein